MHDPFPPPPTFLLRLSHPLSTLFSLHTLPQHIHEILFSCLFYHLLNTLLSPLLSAYFFPSIYPRLRPRSKVSWDAHVVSLVQACLINSLALAVLVLDQERSGMRDWEARLGGYTGASGLVQSFAAGYFVWDLWTALWDFDVHGLGTVVHAVCALGVSVLGYRPFANYYGVPFILYELSTPFLNIHWFLDKLNLTGSRAQWLNGLALMFTFFTSRLVWGNYQCYWLFLDVWNALSSVHSAPSDRAGRVGEAGRGGGTEGEGMRLPVPPWLAVLYVTSMTALSVLNIWWFGRMVKTVMSRFEGRGTGKRRGREREMEKEREKEKEGEGGGEKEEEGNGEEREGIKKRGKAEAQSEKRKRKGEDELR